MRKREGKAFGFGRASVGLIALSLLAGCGDRSAIPYLGKWSGDYTVETAGPGSIGGPERNRLRGFLQLYRTENRYELHLNGEQFGLVATGTWEKGDGRVNLQPKQVKIDDGGGEEKRNPNLPWIKPADLQKAYSSPMTFRLSKDGQSLKGLMVPVGPLIGSHAFVREGFGR